MREIKSPLILLMFLLPALLGCDQQQDPDTKKHHSKRKSNQQLAILPFSQVDAALLQQLKKGIEEKVAIAVTILPSEKLPDYAFYKPRQRYIADSLLKYLKKVKDGRYEKILGVTMKDISTRKEPHANWGVLGLGYCPGEACVISGFRAGKNKVSAKTYQRRMITLALHEIGHTYGLEHCPEFSCLMKDAKGKMNLDDSDSYCRKCAGHLRVRGIMD